MHFTRGGTFRFAPGPSLSKLETFSDVSQQVVNDAAILLRHATSSNCKYTAQIQSRIRLEIRLWLNYADDVFITVFTKQHVQ